MYSDKLKSEKIYTPEANETGASCILYGLDNINKLIDGFCTKEDIIGVPTVTLFNLFDEYCLAEGAPKFNHLSLGKAFRKRFNLERKKVRKGNDLYWVYVDGGQNDGT